jgi:hypothetical protein
MELRDYHPHLFDKRIGISWLDDLTKGNFVGESLRKVEQKMDTVFAIGFCCDCLVFLDDHFHNSFELGLLPFDLFGAGWVGFSFFVFTDNMVHLDAQGGDEISIVLHDSRVLLAPDVANHGLSPSVRLFALFEPLSIS